MKEWPSFGIGCPRSGGVTISGSVLKRSGCGTLLCVSENMVVFRWRLDWILEVLLNSNDSMTDGSFYEIFPKRHGVFSSRAEKKPCNILQNNAVTREVVKCLNSVFCLWLFWNSFEFQISSHCQISKNLFRWMSSKPRERMVSEVPLDCFCN